jgi:hypothetical protein
MIAGVWEWVGWSIVAVGLIVGIVVDQIVRRRNR